MRPVKKMTLKALLLTSCLALPGTALAQEQTQEDGQTLEDIVVTGEIQYRNRTDTVSPELVYDQQFFEQFEPLSVGDQLSRVPGVAFTSDIGERDAPQLRGLGEGFTQVLVNGRPIPGAGNDRTVFVDRIPAEIIDRIEIVRAPSADIDSQGVGGTINIILKDGMSLPPGVIARVGAVQNIDENHLSGLAALSYSGRTEDGTVAWSATFDAQQRYNVKVLDEQVFEDVSPGFDTSFNGRNLFAPDTFDPLNPASSVAVGHQDQVDTRDSTDLSFNGDLTFALSPTSTLRIDSFALSTDREETEAAQSFEREDEDDDGDITNNEFEGPEFSSQLQEIEQTSFGVSALYEAALSEEWSFESQFRYARFLEDSSSTDFEEEVPVPTDLEVVDSDDEEISFDARVDFNSPAFAQSLGIVGFEFTMGGALKQKTRDFAFNVFEDDNEDGDFDDPDDDVTPGSGVFVFEENRQDAFVQAEATLNEWLTLQAGVRIENTDTDAELPDGTSASGDSTEINPSAHMQWSVWQDGQIRASVARTVRRPTLDQVVPFEDSESPGDDDITIGNPALGIETAWGIDIGYEHRIGRRGVIGFNYFRREISDLINLVSTGAPSGSGDGAIYTYANTGDGTVDGFEVDVSTPLDFIGLPDTGFFANYTLLDSERIDQATGQTVRFNAQPEYVYNVGVTQSLADLGMSFGFSYQQQGKSTSTFLGEIEEQWYDGNLEVFIEKRFMDRFVLRLTGNNLLDADSNQAERGYDGDNAAEIADAMIANDIDAFEVERENSSPTVTLTLRAVF